jgi:hypothetical protein
MSIDRQATVGTANSLEELTLGGSYCAFPGCLPSARLVCSTLSMSCIHVPMKSMKNLTLAAIGLSWLKTA